MPLPKAKKKAPRLPRRPKVGIDAAPRDSFDKCKYYFHYEIEPKQCATIVKTWVKKEFTQEEAKCILACPEYKFTMFSHWAATIFWMNEGLEWEERYYGFRDKVRKHYEEYIEIGKDILANKTEDKEEKSNVIRLTPQQLLARKVGETVMQDVDKLEDEWIENKKTTIDLFALFTKYELKAMAVPQVRNRIQCWLEEYTGAYNKECDQLVEGYQNVKRTEIKRRMKACEDMLADLERIVQVGKATRKPRKKKAVTADKQVASLKYQKQDATLKIASVNPVSIPGAVRMLVVNTKYRTITEYITDRAQGFIIKGTTLQGFDDVQSRTKTMRKPEEFLKLCNKTVRQFNKHFEALTTKESKPTGRLNSDCVILKVDK